MLFFEGHYKTLANGAVFSQLSTDATFTTAAGATPSQALVDFQGGPLSTPVLLPSGPVGSLSSPIGGDGAIDF